MDSPSPAIEPQAASPRKAKRAWTVACLILWSAGWVFLLGGYYAATEPLGTDELYSLKTGEENVFRMLKLLSEYHPLHFDHPPLYFLLVHVVLYFSNSPLALRVPSLLFVAAAVSLAAFEASRRFPICVAAAFAVLLAAHPMICFQATFVRMYSLLLLLAVCVYLLLLRIPGAAGRRRGDLAVALALLLAAIFYTSYFGALFGLGVGLTALIWIVRPGWGGGGERRDGLTVIFACFGAALLMIPWVPTYARMLLDESSRSAHGDPRWPQVLAVLKELAGTPAGAVFQLSGWTALIALDHRRKQWGAALVLFAILPLALLALLTPATRNLYDRYCIFSVPVLLAGAAAGWLRLQDILGKGRRPFRLAAALLFLLPALSYAQRARTEFFAPAPGWWGVAEILDDNARPGETILTGGHLSGEAMVYHLRQPEKFHYIHYVTRLDPFYQACRSPQVVWFINAAPLPDEYRKIVEYFFPYRIQVPSNRIGRPIQVCAKRPFRTTP